MVTIARSSTSSPLSSRYSINPLTRPPITNTGGPNPKHRRIPSAASTSSTPQPPQPPPTQPDSASPPVASSAPPSPPGSPPPASCLEPPPLHYQLAYHPGPQGLTSGYHDVLILSTRRGV